MCAAARAAEDMQLQVEAPTEERPTKVVNSEVRALTAHGFWLNAAFTNLRLPSEAFGHVIIICRC